MEESVQNWTNVQSITLRETNHINNLIFHLGEQTRYTYLLLSIMDKSINTDVPQLYKYILIWQYHMNRFKA